MIVSRVVGGLGNQLFQFATGLSLAIDRKTELKLDRSGLDSVSNRGTGTARSFDLELLIPSVRLLEDSDLSTHQFMAATRQGQGPLAKFRYLVLELLELPKGDGATLVSESFSTQFADARLASNSSPNLYISGYWNRPSLFGSYRSELVKLIAPNRIPERLKVLSEEMSRQTSGVLHVRRTDFVSAYASTHAVTSLAYFVEGLRSLEGLCENIYIFSDDIDWCRRNLGESEKVVFVERHDSEHDSAHLWAMTHGKHFVISNSSFSWWAAWLSQAQEKIVFRPANWMVGDKDGGGTYPPEWRIIRC